MILWFLPQYPDFVCIYSAPQPFVISTLHIFIEIFNKNIK